MEALASALARVKDLFNTEMVQFASLAKRDEVELVAKLLDGLTRGVAPKFDMTSAGGFYGAFYSRRPFFVRVAGPDGLLAGRLALPQCLLALEAESKGGGTSEASQPVIDFWKGWLYLDEDGVAAPSMARLTAAATAAIALGRAGTVASTDKGGGGL